MNCFRAWRGYARADADGSFARTHLPPGDYLLWAQQDPYATAKVPRIRVGEGQVAVGVRIQLEPEVPLRCRALGEDGNPLEEVECVARDRKGDIWPWIGIVPDGPGTLVLKGLKAGRYSLTLLSKGYTPARVEVDAGGRNDSFYVRLSRGGSARITAVDAKGRGLEDAALAIRDAAGRDISGEIILRNGDEEGWPRTGLRGELLIENLEPGAYQVWARKAGAISPERVFTVAAGKTAAVVLELPVLSGR
ncbi:MAG: hypothetical protein HY717_12410 [Planctomycetes bacterium]|nr:hypothetical protein [Planctomycetota bacterium]